VIGQTFPLEQAAAAHAAVEERHTLGKTLFSSSAPVELAARSILRPGHRLLVQLGAHGAGDVSRLRRGVVSEGRISWPTRGPNVGWTIGSTMRSGVRRGMKEPANEGVQRRSSSDVVVPDSACHAGGRGFESRRSRLSKCLQTGTFCCLIRRLHRARGRIPGPNVIGTGFVVRRVTAGDPAFAEARGNWREGGRRPHQRLAGEEPRSVPYR
jgi:hypothetical protein